ncbi:FAD-dependent monooxygenase [Yinghuangia sp. ASG 101]|uniref:FAD-dependent oxidoreductase n=1 Tax=Yinghuangia sp. ASG 101 TaxID=2896848 RepID=UPI001E2C4D7D|nr:FAD-dependent oxidoreductase [Yinghuangia sp. ASG 101]UGQ11379.1 FAD-dependent monooxygenase [Yinghuangia sp. ASG 101]
MENHTSALIIGAGPVGLSAALELGRRGVPCTVVERHRRLGRRSRVAGVNKWTMELFHYWGIGDEIHRAALPFGATGPVTWKRTLAGETLGPIRRDASRPETWSPTVARAGDIMFCPSDAVESALLAAVRRCPSVDIHFSTRLRGFENTEEGVTAELTYGNGEPGLVRADYLLACDGINSGVRKMLGIPLDGMRMDMDLVAIDFEADLRTWTGERPCVAYWIINSVSCGCLVPRLEGPRWIYTAFRRPDAAVATEEWCEDVVRAATGVPTLPLRITDAQPRSMTIEVVSQFRSRRVFLAGDAAHRFLPMLGPGINLGVHDAYDFAWKAAAVWERWADPTLLDTYEPQRAAAAKRTSEHTAEFLRLMAETGISADVYDFATALEEDGEDAAALREMVRDAARKLEGHWAT